MKSLKDALLKAGVKPTQDPKVNNAREKVAKKHMTDAVSHQSQRNYCEACQQVKPDVERYEHRNPTTEAEWICLRCADELQISDNFRRTAQSDSSIKRMFRREFGATVQIAANKDSGRPKGPVNGNR